MRKIVTCCSDLVQKVPQPALNLSHTIFILKLKAVKAPSKIVADKILIFVLIFIESKS